ncbi:Cna B-type domain-containing protein [Brevibacterium ihuae]|uniref:Cna B-type domain-containing protein n=1 Tax=Brevibacterium ihuae TaxID=1631743 RepID=UPI000C7749B7|nr:Cna B-type domain-containing protein [Brevibacterium ihuae]
MLSAAPLTVPAGARATLGEGLTIAGTTTANLSYTLIEVQGALVMLDGATVRDATNYTTNNAPIHVSGAGATFVMRGGEIRDNHSHRQAGRAAGALKVDTGGRAELLGGVIRDNSARTGGGDGSGAVLIGPGGSGVLDGTVISGNASPNGAGVNVVSFDRFDVSSPEERAAKAARFEIFSGTIEGNTASNGGGGVSVMGNAHVTMSGGTISGNSARGGGGVNVWDLCYAGDASGARTDLYCAHYGIDFEDWRNLYAGEFTLTGGEITDNTASSTGGGINIVSDNVTLAGGTISGNSAKLQGGGVYVTTVPYTAQINNSLITENTATADGGSGGYGGGIWSCPTGEIEMFVNQGTAVHTNAAATAGDDFVSEIWGRTPEFTSTFSFSERALGGAANGWAHDGAVGGMDDRPRFDPADPQALEELTFADESALHNDLEADGPALAAAKARLTITGNSAPRGGGVGTNGGLRFGEPGEASIEVEKAWENVPDGVEIPESVRMQLVRTHDGREFVIDEFEVRAEDGWRTTLTGLPTTDIDGDPIDYSEVFAVSESDAGDWTVSISVIAGGDGEHSVTVTNTWPEPTDDPTPTADPTATEEPGPTPEPTATDEPGPTPEPTATDEPTSTADSSPSPDPSAPGSPAPEPSAPGPGEGPDDSEGDDSVAGPGDRDGSGDPLPRTGAGIAAGLGLGFGAVALGTALLLLQRRRSER